MAVEETLVSGVTDTPAQEASQAQESKTYSQEEVDNMMARMRGSLEKKLLKPYEDLGDPEELRELKARQEQQRQEEQLKRGEFEKTLQEKMSAKEAEIQKRDKIIEDYKLNMPLVNAAAKSKAVNPEQVQALLRGNVRLGESGEAEVLDSTGAVRYDDSGAPMSVEAFVEEWLGQNPHFLSAAPATTNTKSNVMSPAPEKIDLATLDLTDSQNRKIYKEAQRKGLI